MQHNLYPVDFFKQYFLIQPHLPSLKAFLVHPLVGTKERDAAKIRFAMVLS